MCCQKRQTGLNKILRQKQGWTLLEYCIAFGLVAMSMFWLTDSYRNRINQARDDIVQWFEPTGSDPATAWQDVDNLLNY